MVLRAVIPTARLTLRPLVASDEADVIAGIGERQVACWLSTAPHPYGPEDFAVFLGGIEHCGVWAVDDGSGCVGTIGLSGGFGYWLARRVWGRGYATEAARAVLAEHFADPEAGPVRSGYFDGNHRSARVLAKLGFVPDGFRMTACAVLGGSKVLLCSLCLSRDAWLAADPRAVGTDGWR